ncbi:importin-11 isoform X1 [Micractinium conductrix]|uniref:Importin-11 isoform X1 n=1 Tax=Micractinium conductrix TaxID=554055 RepID=A0A2P6V098_9CHLO|nr:importin-11 isoform X1 [Micractinium conductrix]|eukprot:PSC67511.1 importin-11 isoform X1 [Micractinium conductrix]
MEDAVAQAAPLPARTVITTLEAALSFDNATRGAAEAQLREWESDAAPGFIGSLLKVVAEVQAVPEDGRLMAAVVAKNAVGSSWRKTLGSREWSRVPEEEKQYIRSTAMAALLGDPSDRVALQITLLITNIARFDVPQPWATLLPDLAAAAAEESSVAVPAKKRALTALKHVLQALRGKKFVISTPRDARMLSEQEFEELAQGVAAQRQQLEQQCKGLLAPLRAQWEGHTGALLAGGDGWQRRGAAAAAALSALRELMHVLQDFDGVEEAFAALMTELHQAAAAVAPQLLAGPLAAAAMAAAATGGGASAEAAAEGDPQLQRWRLLGKNWERLLQVALVTMDRHTFQFAAHLPALLSLCINACLLAMDASLVHHMRAKARVVLVRFCARALLQQLYRRDFVEGGSPEARYVSDAGREAIGKFRAQLLAAADALDALLAPAQCPALVQAIVQKYIMLSPDEVAEWGSDPESFARNVDVETSPDADTPRPCGVALLECMLERADEPVAAALLAMAAQQQAAPLSPDTTLQREGTYRAIGECFTHLRTKVDFNAWYSGELRLILTSADMTGLHGSILRAGALWLLGVCGAELHAQHWGEALALTVTHVRHEDVVVALMAVSALTVLLSNCLEESQFVSAPPARKRLILEGPLGGAGGAALLGSDEEEGGDLSAAVDAEFAAHMAAVEAQTDAIVASCFGLLPRLAEIESMVRVLQCVSSTVELLGDRLRPHLPTICSALPQVWQVISQRRQEGAGGLARLHSALISTVTHLLLRLGSAAVADPRVAELLYPLLMHATNLGSPDSEPLVDDGLRLLSAVLSTSDALPQPLQEMAAARLPPILRRGHDTAACLRIAEGLALLGGLPAVAPLLPQPAAAIAASLGAAVTAAAAGKQAITDLMAAPPGASHQPRPPSKSLTAEQAAEGTAAAGLLNVLVQLCEQAAAGQPGGELQLPAELQPAAKAAAAVAAADFGGGVVRLPSQGVSLVEACLEVVGRLLFKQPSLLPVLLDGNSDGEARLLDRWVILGGARDIVEMFMPALGTLGRVRRHRAAVTLCSLLYADSIPLLHAGPRAAQALALGLRAAREQEHFARDQQRLAEMQMPDPTHSDQLVLRRRALARSDPVKAIDAQEAARAAATKVAGWLGEAALQAALQAVDPLLVDQLNELMGGRGAGGGPAQLDNGGGDDGMTEGGA